MQFKYTALERVIYGEKVASALSAVAQDLGSRRIYIVASSTLAKETNQFKELTQAIGDRFVGLSTGIGAHTPREDVLNVLREVRVSKADLLVAVGGGSVIDGCKTIQLAIDQQVQTEDQLLDYAQRTDGTRGSKCGDSSLFQTPAAIRQIAVPTTLSGAEFSNLAGVLDSKRQAKEGYMAPTLCPQVIIYDSELSKHTPHWLFLSTAIRSLDHAIEGYCSADTTPYHDGHFLHAIRLFSQALPLMADEPENLEARQLSQQAVWLACCGLATIAFGASHGIGYILGSLCGVPHGYTSCVMLPAVLRWNHSVNSERQQAIAEALGSAAEDAAISVQRLIARLGLPVSLKELDIKLSKLDEIAERAIRHPVVKCNPRTVSSVEQVREILDLAWNAAEHSL
ncbi:MAG: iron-containing alcohol dehydrogenase [Gammaproteobacteria bacterium]|nr:iron-containing alcohol dehydrogenase [Gammaproteobacteria bacterium]